MLPSCCPLNIRGGNTEENIYTRQGHSKIERRGSGRGRRGEKRKRRGMKDEGRKGKEVRDEGGREKEGVGE